MTEVSSPEYKVEVGIVGQTQTTLAENAPASGSLEIPVQAGDQIRFTNRKTRLFGISILMITDFRFIPPAPPMIFRSGFEAGE